MFTKNHLVYIFFFEKRNVLENYGPFFVFFKNFNHSLLRKIWQNISVAKYLR